MNSFYFITLLNHVLLMNCEFSFENYNKIKETNQNQCELIKGECTDQGYSYTSASKLISDDSSYFGSQIAADAVIKSFQIMFSCSNYFKNFLCGTYKPSCHEEATLIIQPCKSMCEHVYKRCFPLMKKFKRQWNSELNCSRFLGKFFSLFSF
jgi:hypothetical protein